MKIKSVWFVIGVSAFSVVLGFMIGASNSPVVGAAFSGLFGLGVALLGLLKKEQKEAVKFNTENIGLIGKTLFFFSTFLFVGLFIGENYRNDNISFLQEKQVIPWGDNPPKTTQEALDWIVISQKLKQFGYSNSQVEAIYKIRVKNIDTYSSISDILGKLNPPNGKGPKSISTDGYPIDIEALNEKIQSFQNNYDPSYPFHEMISNKLLEKSGRGPASTD